VDGRRKACNKCASDQLHRACCNRVGSQEPQRGHRDTRWKSETDTAGLGGWKRRGRGQGSRMGAKTASCWKREKPCRVTVHPACPTTTDTWFFVRRAPCLWRVGSRGVRTGHDCQVTTQSREGGESSAVFRCGNLDKSLSKATADDTTAREYYSTSTVHPNCLGCQTEAVLRNAKQSRAHTN
jgi:hypothetical protein